MFRISINPDDIEAIECKHVVYGKSLVNKGNYPDDMILIKERIHLKDKTTVPNVRTIINPQVPYYITKPIFRNHKEKKTREFIDRVEMRTSTQAGRIDSVKRALNIVSNVRSVKQLARNPYVYGLDLPVTSFYKKKYMDKYPGVFSENSLAVLDIETDVANYGGSRVPTEDPILLQLTFRDKAILVVTDQWLKLTPIDPKTGKHTKPMSHSEFIESAKKYIPERLKDTFELFNTQLEVVVASDPLEAIKVIFYKAHRWMPDFISVWNIDFDIPKIFNTVKKYGGNISDILSDPSVPPEFRDVYYDEGQRFKRTQSGDETPLHWVDQWHTVRCLSSFYFIDQACVFRKMRFAGGKEPSYSLAAILAKYSPTRKLNDKNDITKDMTDLQWHQYMQVHEKLEYSAYAIQDCQGCEVLDMQPKVKDLAISISNQCRHSDYDKFPSQPKRSVENMYYTCLDNNLVLGSTSDNLHVKEFDDITVGINDWIVTLAAHMIISNGLKCLIDVPTLATFLYVAVYDQLM